MTVAITANKTFKNPYLHGAYILAAEAESKQDKPVEAQVRWGQAPRRKGARENTGLLGRGKGKPPREGGRGFASWGRAVPARERCEQVSSAQARLEEAWRRPARLEKLGVGAGGG